MSEFNRERFRQTVDFTVVDGTYRHRSWNSQTGWTWDPDSHGQVAGFNGWTGSKETTKDYVTKGFLKKKRQGQVILGGLYHQFSERSMTPGQIQRNYPDSYWTGYDVLTGDFACKLRPSTPQNVMMSVNDIVKMRQIALIKAYARINESAIMSGEILHDLDQSVSMLRRPFKNSRDLLKRMFKARKLRLGKTAASAARATADAWLEYRYGWQPVILDCETIIKESHRIREDCNRRRCVARAGQSMSYSGTTLLNQAPVTGTLTGIGTLTANREVRVSAGVLYDIASRTTLEHLEQILGYRPRDLPQTFWEIVPYSFVVDWFINVGDWLQAITPVPGIDILGNWVTSVDKLTEDFQLSTIQWKSPGSPPITCSGSGGASVETTTDIWRVVNSSLASTPVLTVKSLSALRSADAMALSVGPIIRGLVEFKRRHPVNVREYTD